MTYERSIAFSWSGLLKYRNFCPKSKRFTTDEAWMRGTGVYTPDTSKISHPVLKIIFLLRMRIVLFWPAPKPECFLLSAKRMSSPAGWYLSKMEHHCAKEEQGDIQSNPLAFWACLTYHLSECELASYWNYRRRSGERKFRIRFLMGNLLEVQVWIAMLKYRLIRMDSWKSNLHYKHPHIWYPIAPRRLGEWTLISIIIFKSTSLWTRMDWPLRAAMLLFD